MLMRLLVSVALLLSLSSRSAAQQDSAPQPYADKDAYQVYDALLADRAASGRTLAIQQETTPLSQGHDSGWGADKPESCLAPDVAESFKDAIADYDRLNQKKWLLQRSFSTHLNYELLDSPTANSLLADAHREDLYKRFPGGFYVMSAVGFNKDRSKAIVFFGHACGNLCGAWSLHLLQKSDGYWRELDHGISCVTVSQAEPWPNVVAGTERR